MIRERGGEEGRNLGCICTSGHLLRLLAYRLVVSISRTLGRAQLLTFMILKNFFIHFVGSI